MGNSLVEDMTMMDVQVRGRLEWVEHVRANARRDLWVLRKGHESTKRMSVLHHVRRAKLWEIDDIACFATMKR